MHPTGVSILTALAVISSACGANTATGAPINYGDFLGASAGDVDFLQVTEDSATDATPLFGAPSHVGNSLFFFPLTFGSSSADGSSDDTLGVLTMQIRADDGYYLDRIALYERGDTTLAGAGSSLTASSVSGILVIDDLVPGTHGPMGGTLNYTPSAIYTLPDDSFVEFDGIVEIDLAGLGITEIAFDLANLLQTTSEAGTTAFIQKKIIQASVVSVPIPEPASISCLVLILLVVRRPRPRPPWR